MIYLRAYRVLKTTSGRIITKKVHFEEEIKWTNDFNEFNIFDPREWKKFLSTYEYRPGKLLPSVSEGEPVAYFVKVVGMSKEMQDYFDHRTGKGGKGSIIQLFPGYHEDGTRRDFKVYGAIR